VSERYTEKQKEEILETKALVFDMEKAMHEAAIKALEKVEDRKDAWLFYGRALNGLFSNHYGMSLFQAKEATHLSHTPPNEEET
jgi:hypothetical protein